MIKNFLLKYHKLTKENKGRKILLLLLRFSFNLENECKIVQFNHGQNFRLFTIKIIPESPSSCPFHPITHH